MPPAPFSENLSGTTPYSCLKLSKIVLLLDFWFLSLVLKKSLIDQMKADEMPQHTLTFVKCTKEKHP
jgi:hypothetical protein